MELPHEKGGCLPQRKKPLYFHLMYVEMQWPFVIF